MMPTKGDGRAPADRSRGQFRRMVDNSINHPKGNKGKRKGGYESASSASESQGKGKRQRQNTADSGWRS